MVDVAEAAGRVRAAVEAGTGLVVVARTDALSVRGLDSVVERCLAFADAGADAVFVEGAGLAELGAVADALAARGHRTPQVYNRSEAGGAIDSGPADEELHQVGVRLVIHPVSALLAATHAVRRAMDEILTSGHAGSVDRLAWPELTDLVGLPGLLDDERRYAAPVAARLEERSR